MSKQVQLHHVNQLVYDFLHIVKHVPWNQKYPCLRQHCLPHHTWYTSPWILLIARNMFDDVQKVIDELVYVV